MRGSKQEDNSFSLFGGGDAATGEEQASFSSLFQPAGGDAGKWGAFPLESPIVARTHSIIPDMKTPGFLANQRESFGANLNDSYQSKKQSLNKSSRNTFKGGESAEEKAAREANEFHMLQQQEEEQEKAGEEETAVRNEMFFTISASNKPIVERKFVLASDRRAAAKRKNNPQHQQLHQQKEEFIPLAERLHKIQTAKEEEDEDAAIEQTGGVMTFAPFRPTVPKEPTFQTKNRAQDNYAAPKFQAEHAAPQQQQNVVRPALTIAKTPKFATKNRARKQTVDDELLDDDDDPSKASKRFRSLAVNRAAAEGGAMGVPMIPKMALTRPEEFDFATAARELAKEGQMGQQKQMDVFEQAAADVRGTNNKIGMYVDLDTNLDQETVVAKRATTGKKRNPGRSRLPGMEGEDDLVQPDFGDDVDEVKPVKKSRHQQQQQQQQPVYQQHQQQHQQQVAPPQLTIPKTPNFATSKRAQSKISHKSSPSPRRPLQQIVKEKAAQLQQAQKQQHVQPPQLTIPKTPNFATKARARPAREYVNEDDYLKPTFEKPRPVQQQQQQPAYQPAQFLPLTEPKPFSFATDSRVGRPSKSIVDRPEKLEKPQPSAVPVKMAHADKYSTALTEPKPFSFATNARLGEPAKQRVENAHPNSAQYAPPPQHNNIFGLTEPQPFNLRVEARGQVSKEVQEKKLKEREEEERQRHVHQYKAKPFVDQPAPFPQVKSSIPLTNVQEFVLNSDVRAVRRAEFEQAERQRRMEEAKFASERERERQEREEQEVREMRKRMVPKARPVGYGIDSNPLPQKRAPLALTVPQSPQFATSKRAFNRP